MTRDLKTIDELDDRPLNDDRDLSRLVNALLERALGRRVWFLLLDGSLRWTKVIIPIDDVPSDPHEVAAMPSDGPVTTAQLLAARFSEIVRATPADHIVVVWERTGAPTLDETDLAWIDAVEAAFAEDPAALRAQLVLTDDGARLVRRATEERAA